MELTDAQTAVLLATVAAEGETGLADVAERVAGAVAEAEPASGRSLAADRFAAWIREAVFLPAVPTLANAGRGGQLAACFVLEPDDSLESIYETLGRAARIQQGSGGVGIHFSRLRPMNRPIARSGGRSPGPAAFMELFANSARINSLAGRRMGAHLAVLRDDHPDVMEFVRQPRGRSDGGSGLGLALGSSGALLEEARREATHALHDAGGAEVGRLPARLLLNELVDSIYETGEPTLLFLDRIADANPVPSLGRIEAANPCGEQPLLADESCVLGSLQLPALLDPDHQLDVSRLREATRDAMRFLDDVIEVNAYPDERIAAATKHTRKVGLGIMGFADVLLLQGTRYGTPASVELAHQIMGVLWNAALEASEALARERGPFRAWGPDARGPRRRNATLLAIAPTGTLRLLAGCSGGLEPFLQPVLRIGTPRGRLRWADRWLSEWLGERCGDPDRVLAALEAGTPSAELPGLSDADRFVLPAPWEIAPEEQIEVQAAFQAHVDGAVSKTVHLDEAVTRTHIAELAQLAHDAGCKGIAFYRRVRDAGAPEIRLADPLCSACGS